MPRYWVDLYNADDLDDRDKNNRDNGLMFTLSATSGKYGFRVEAACMDDACAETLRIARSRGLSMPQEWGAHINMLKANGTRVCKHAGLQMIAPPADVYRHIASIAVAQRDREIMDKLEALLAANEDNIA